MDRKLISRLLGISEKSYYRWKESRKIFLLIEKYFTDNDIKEFLETEKITKFENIEIINYLQNECYQFYINLLKKFPENIIKFILNFLRKQIKLNQKTTIAELAQFIFNSDDLEFGNLKPTHEEIRKYRLNPTKKMMPERTPQEIKLTLLIQFQEIDSMIFDYFCKYFDEIILLRNENVKSVIDRMKNKNIEE